MECHDSSVFLIRKLPLSITAQALLKSMEWSWDHAWFAILEPLAANFHIHHKLLFFAYLIRQDLHVSRTRSLVFQDYHSCVKGMEMYRNLSDPCIKTII